MTRNKQASTRMFVETNHQSVAAVRTLLESSLPVAFSPSYYNALASGGLRSLELWSDDMLLGQVSWDPTDPAWEGKSYLYSLAVDVRFRDEGRGTALMRRMLGEVTNNMILHVHSGNEEAIRFYKRLGFTKIHLVANFYPRLTPRDAWVMERPV